jgi:hypothetical protein
LDDETGEAWVHLDTMNGEAGRPQRTLSGRDEPVHGGAGQAEEVEVASLALNVAAGDQRGASGEGEVLCLLEACDDPGDPLL